MKWILEYIPLLIQVLILFLPSLLFAGENENSKEMVAPEQVYNSRLQQFRFLTTHSETTDSLPFYLQNEAALFARQENWEIALDLLDQALEAMIEPSGEPPTDQTGTQISGVSELPGMLSLNRWEWSVEAGSDYSRQEYEMTLIESDSVILEELNNPYVALRLARPGLFKGFNFQQYYYIRSDQQLLQGTGTVSLETPDYQQHWRLEGMTNLYVQYDEKQGNFWENQFSGSWNRSLNGKNRLLFFSHVRFKYSLDRDSLFGNILITDLSAAFRHYFKFSRWLELKVRPSLYDEYQVPGLKYQEIRTSLEFNDRQDFIRYFRFNIQYRLRNFTSEQPDGSVRNIFHSLAPEAAFEIPVLKPFGIEVRNESEFRWYGDPDIAYSGFVFTTAKGLLKFYADNYSSFGAGYVYEIENHTLDDPSLRALANQEDYFAHGFLLTADILRINGLLINITYQYTLRTHPHGGIDDLLGYYSNRKIHSIQGIGYVPLSRNWQLQFFANYDNDRDRDREANDNFSTIFNLGVLYQF